MLQQNRIRHVSGKQKEVILMKKILALVLAALMAFGVFAVAGAETADPSGTLTIYSPHDADPLNAGVSGFEAKYPNVKFRFMDALPRALFSISMDTAMTGHTTDWK